MNDLGTLKFDKSLGIFVMNYKKPTIKAAYECPICHGITHNINIPESELTNYKKCTCNET
jgi:hypothetical protein